jgi:hypothetical protein
VVYIHTIARIKEARKGEWVAFKSSIDDVDDEVGGCDNSFSRLNRHVPLHTDSPIASFYILSQDQSGMLLFILSSQSPPFTYFLKIKQVCSSSYCLPNRLLLHTFPRTIRYAPLHTDFFYTHSQDQTAMFPFIPSPQSRPPTYFGITPNPGSMCPSDIPTIASAKAIIEMARKSDSILEARRFIQAVPLAKIHWGRLMKA